MTTEDSAPTEAGLMQVGPGEPQPGAWRLVGVGEVVAMVVAAAPLPLVGPRIVAVDGRSGGGKSTFAQRLAAAVQRSAVVHVDDVAWHAPMFGWSDLMEEGVLQPLRRGQAVSYRPPAWEVHGRPGAIEVPGGLEMVVVEGVGAGRGELTELIDVLIWVQSDYAEAERLGLARDIASGVNGDADATVEFWHEWMSAEVPFLERDRPWERADIVAAGTSSLPRPAGQSVLVATR